MPLSPIDREELDKIINFIIGAVPVKIHITRTRLLNELRLQSERDFVFGTAFGEILSDFSCYFTQARKRGMTSEEVMEANQVILRRSREIDDAIRGVHT